MEDQDGLLNIRKMQEYSRQFVHQREWEKFHSPKNLAIGLMIEAAELNEIFHWLTDKESKNVSFDPKIVAKIKDELGDVLHYLIRLSDLLSIDLDEAFWQKLSKTENKYPAEHVRGKAEKYAELH